MLDLITAILEELFGQPKQTAQPRRRVQPGGDGRPVPGATREEAPSRQDLGNMVREMFGLDPDEEDEPASPPPPPEPQPVAPPPVVRVRPTQRQPLAGTLGIVATDEPQAAAPSPARTATAMPDYVARLRNNPAAARDAFVYSEIFGPPLADR